MRWTTKTSEQRRSEKMARRRLRLAAHYYDKWFAWYPVKLNCSNERAWMETVEYTEEWLSPTFCLRRYFRNGFFESQREAARMGL